MEFVFWGCYLWFQFIIANAMGVLETCLIVLVVLNLTSASKDCLVYEDQCIFVDSSNGTVTYDVAEKNCAEHGGRLVSIPNSQKNNFVLQTVLQNISSTKLWFGLQRGRYSSTWQRSDGTNISNSDFTTWGNRNDDYYSRYCAAIDSSSGNWDSTNCNNNQQAICELPNCELSQLHIRHAQFDKCGETTFVGVGTNLSVTCNQGFILNGSELISCAPNGWTEIPTCEPGCQPPELSNGVMVFNRKDYYKVGEELLVYCEKGYLLGDENLKAYQIVICDPDGTWPSLKQRCITDQRLKCQDHVCTEMSVTAKLNSSLTLTCPIGEDNTNYSYCQWVQNHVPILLEKSNDYIINETELIIPQFNSDSVGIYSCVKGQNETNIEKIFIFNVNIEKSCPEAKLHHLPAINTTEGESIYLYSSGAALNAEVYWFKDGKRLVANENVNILPNGDILIKKATVNDEGSYKFNVQNEVPNCFDEYTVDVHIKLENYCGISENINDQPWLAALWSKDEIIPFCYGTLINEYWLISSAFCLSRFYRQKTTNVVAQFRSNSNISMKTDGDDLITEIQAEQFVIHPQYSRRLNVNDIGLLKFKQPVTFSKKIKPICLSSTDFQAEQDKLCEKRAFSGLVSGWGSVEALTPGDLEPVGVENLTVASKENCQKCVWFEFPDKLFCATPDGLNTELAKLVGDAGSPFLVWENGRYYLQGVFSWGERIAQIGKNDYFVRVSSYYDWIMSVVGQ